MRKAPQRQRPRTDHFINPEKREKLERTDFMGMIFETHAHYNDEAFQEDREEIFADLSLKGHVRLFPFAAAAAQIWFNRDFQTVFKRLKNRKKDDGGKHG